MLHKKSTLTVHNGRGVTQFFNRIQDVFERKFDGFPAKSLNSSATTPGAPTSDLGEIDFGAIAEEIAESIFNTGIPECSDVPESDCGGTSNDFENGGLIAAWGGPNGLGGTWAKLDSTFNSSPLAFSGNHIEEGIYLTGANDVYYGGKAYLTGFTYGSIINWRIDFILNPKSTSDNTSSDNQMNIILAGTSAEMASGTVNGRAASFWWNRTGFAPSSGYNMGAGNVPFSFSGGVQYSCRFKVDTVNRTIQFKFWETSTGEPASYTNTSGYTASQSPQLGFRLVGGNTWPAGTRPSHNGVSYWVGEGESASPFSEGEDCGGSSTFAVLNQVEGSAFGDREFAPSLPVDYYIQVWINGLAAVKHEDYTTTSTGSIVLNEGIDTTDIEVTARYVIA